MTREQRRVIFEELIRQIKAGDFDSSSFFLRDMLNSNPPAPGRQEYLPPYQRDSYNYGYMTSGEIGAGNTEAL